MKEIGNVLLGVVLLGASFSCNHRVAEVDGNPSPTATQATPVTDIKYRWEEESKKLEPIKRSREYPGKQLDVMEKLLGAAPPAQVKSELERIRKEPNDYNEMSDYDRFLLQALFTNFARAGDRDMLVYLLSAKCPRFIATSPVELEIASMETKDPFLILFDSYDHATDTEKHFLLNVLRDSLKDLSEKYSDDSEFVSKSRTWYKENASRIKTNPYYHPAGRAEQRDLFVPTS